MTLRIGNPNWVTGDLKVFNYTTVSALDRGVPCRPIDSKTVADIAESVKQRGFLEPITIVMDEGKGYRVISGHHRYDAFMKLITEADDDNKIDYTLPARIVFVTKADEEALQISENLHRNDLTAAQRKDWAMRYGQLTHSNPNGTQKDFSPNGTNKDSNPNGTRKRGGQKDWFSDWFEGARTPRNTAFRWWNEFKKANGLTITPTKASDEQKEQFFAWHLAQIKAEKPQPKAESQPQPQPQPKQPESKPEPSDEIREAVARLESLLEKLPKKWAQEVVMACRHWVFMVEGKVKQEARTEFEKAHPDLAAEYHQAIKDADRKMQQENCVHSALGNRSEDTNFYGHHCPAQFTPYDFALLRSFFHTDRVPQGEEERYRKAFQALSKLEPAISALKKMKETEERRSAAAKARAAERKARGETL